MVDALLAIAVGLVQGVTEFLPISSSAHIALIESMGLTDPMGQTMAVAVHAGTLVAVMWFCRKTIGNVSLSFIQWKSTGGSDRLLGYALVVSTLPLVLIAPFVKDLIENTRSADIIAVVNIFFAIFLAIAWSRRSHQDDASNLPSFPPQTILWHATLIGLAQCAAMVPGVSRAGVTLTAALALRWPLRIAAPYIFLLAIPAVLGAVILEVVSTRVEDITTSWSLLALGTITAMMAALLTLNRFVAFVQGVGMWPFVVYRLALSAVIATVLLLA